MYGGSYARNPVDVVKASDSACDASQKSMPVHSVALVTLVRNCPESEAAPGEAHWKEPVATTECAPPTTEPGAGGNSAVTYARAVSVPATSIWKPR